MKIGFVIYGSLDTVSGGYLYDRKLVEYLRAQGDTVEIISLPWKNYASHLSDNIRFRLPRDLDLIIQDELNHPSLLFANRLPHPCPTISLVHHLRCSEYRPKWQNAFYRAIEKKYLQSVDGFIFNSETTKNVVIGLIDKDKPSIVAYPPTDKFGQGLADSEIIERSKSDDLRIVFLGNVIHRKGLHILLKAVEGLKSKFRLDVVGGMTAETRYARSMKEYVNTHGLAMRVSFRGLLENERLAERLRQAHLLAVPSSYEGFGIVYLEGMSFALPAIGTTAGSASEIITHGRDGYLIQPDDQNALTNHLSELAADRDLLLRMSMNAVNRYKSQQKWPEIAKAIRGYLYQMAEGIPSDDDFVTDLNKAHTTHSSIRYEK